MKSLLLILLVVLCTPASADAWTAEDKYREAAFVALVVVDWAQTREIARNPRTYAENGLVAREIIGEHPSVAQVDAYMLASILLQYAIADALPEDYRATFQYITIIDRANSVVNNFSIGLRVAF